MEINTHTQDIASSSDPSQQHVCCPPHTHRHTHHGLIFHREAAVGISQCFPPITRAVHTLSLSLRHAKTDRCRWAGMNGCSAASSLSNVPAPWAKLHEMAGRFGSGHQFVLRAQEPEVKTNLSKVVTKQEAPCFSFHTLLRISVAQCYVCE